jgi:hypothetical protein
VYPTHRKSAVRLLRSKPVREVLAYARGEAVKFKPEKKRPANRTGKRFYTDEAIESLRLVWTHMRENPRPLMRQQIQYIAAWPAFHITQDIAEKLKTISPATIDRYLKKDKAALTLKGKRLATPLYALKSRIPIRTFGHDG